MRWLLIAAALLLVAGIGWYFRGEIAKLFWSEEEKAAADTVLLLVETVPKNATIYVDGVQSANKSIRLPRSDRRFTIRVKADRYHGEEIEVTASKTRVLRVVLKPKSRKKRR